MNREHIMAVLYDMAMTIGSEVRLRPLLARTLQRLLYHTSFPVGLVFLDRPRRAGAEVLARLELAIGDWALCGLAGQDVTVPAELLEGGPALREDAALLAALPGPRPDRYGSFLRLPIDGQGVLLLLAPRTPHSELPLVHVFQPVMANLARAILLCREHERTLRESADTLQAMTDAALDAIIMLDGGGRISFWNRSAERVFGYARGEALGKPLHDLLAPERYRAAFGPGFERFRVSGEGPVLGRHMEVYARRKGGEEFPAELSISALQLHGQWMAVGILRDVAERRRIEEELRQSQKLESVARLAGGVAHDFNNLLTVILSGAEHLLEAVDPGNPLREDVQDVEAAARRAAALTRQLLAFSRKEVVQPVVLDVSEIVSGMVRMLKRLIGEDVELITPPGAPLWPVRADPGQLEQVVLNLAVNARDAMPSGGRLWIETANVEVAPGRADPEGPPPGAWVRLAVRDTGCGMDTDVRAHLFEPFFTTKRAGKGTGLGLSTVYGIVQQSGGQLRVVSEVGKGSCFEVYLPRAAPGAAAESLPRPVPLGAGTETVLLVEDDVRVRRVAAGALRAAGYAVVEAVDGLEALERLERAAAGHVDVLVTDLVMPRLGGEELARRVREARPDLPILFVSGYADHALELGPFGERAALLQKPFTASVLTVAVRKVLERRGPAAAPDSGRRAPGT